MRSSMKHHSQLKARKVSATAAEDMASGVQAEATESEQGQNIKRVLGGLRISCMSASPDGTHLAVGGSEGKVRLVELATGEHIHVHHASEDSVQELHWSPDGQKLVIDCYSGALTVWDQESNSSKRIMGMHATWSPDGGRLCTGLRDENACMTWNVSTGAVEASLLHKNEFDFFLKNHISPRPKWLPNNDIRVMFRDGFIKTLWATEGYRVEHVAGKSLRSVCDDVFLGWDPNGDHYTCVDHIGEVQLTNAACVANDGQKYIHYLRSEREYATGLLPASQSHITAYRPVGSVLAVGTVKKQVIIWDYLRDHVYHILDMENKVTAVVWSACGDVLFVASLGNIHVFPVYQWWE